MELKTLKEYIDESALSKKDKALFYSNMKEYHGDDFDITLNHPCFGFAHALACGFNWDKTEQGFNYWNKFAMDIKLNKNNDIK